MLMRFFFYGLNVKRCRGILIFMALQYLLAFMILHANVETMYTIYVKKIGFVMQDFALVPDLSVFDNVAVPLYIAGARGSVIEKQVRALLDEVGLSDKIRNRADDLSGGQKQRVALARAMVYSPKLLLADEPTGALDQSTGKEMLRLMLKYQEKGTALVIVTHDPEVAGACGRRIELADGKVSHCEI